MDTNFKRLKLLYRRTDKQTDTYMHTHIETTQQRHASAQQSFEIVRNNRADG